ncbi:hypothetical protein H1D31_03410 [Alishewanella sp. BS5-314]|uniref:hypothetical protein n=1 Tax=Alishewanella sp. BS5-314 TaxID=2755587 RepID=UPI0021BBA720|nr:hypothetical protein [Alishewanella sp. BS5-314]MCT8125090.1 hypothetical protein [Alishewanella sp. BS5-314]
MFRRIPVLNLFTSLIFAFSFMAHPVAASQLETMEYRGAAVTAHKGPTADFPAEFMDKLLCEGGQSGPSKNAGCVQLNSDGSGTWENDAGPGQRMPPAPVSWFIVTNSEGVPLKNDGAERKTWQVIFRFEQGDRYNPQGSLYAVAATLVLSPQKRVIVHSKYRDL